MTLFVGGVMADSFPCTGLVDLEDKDGLNILFTFSSFMLFVPIELEEVFASVGRLGMRQSGGLQRVIMRQ